MPKHHTKTNPEAEGSRRHFDAAFKQEAVALGKCQRTRTFTKLANPICYEVGVVC